MRRISGRNQAIYESGKVASTLASAGIKVVSEVPSDYIIYCPFHDNHRTPAGEVSKETGVFYCFSCHKSCTLEELVMRTTGRSYFQVLRMIDSGVVSLDNILDTRSKPHLVEFPQGILTDYMRDSMNAQHDTCSTGASMHLMSLR